MLDVDSTKSINLQTKSNLCCWKITCVIYIINIYYKHTNSMI